MLYTLTEKQRNSYLGVNTVQIPEGYKVLKVGDPLPEGCKGFINGKWDSNLFYSVNDKLLSPYTVYIAPLPKMDKWENLVIRICKGIGNKPYKLRMIRRALARRCALKVEWVEEQFVFSFLFDLAKRYKEINFCRLVEESAPKEVWKVGMKETDSHFLRFAAVLVSEITHTKGKDLIGYASSAGFRNRQKNNKLIS
jgi:hypothetical protein